VQSYDLALTALHYAAVDAGELDFDGQSLRPLLGGHGEAEDLDRSAFSCTGTPWPAVRHANFKYCVNTKQHEAVLFDLEQDPIESVNLAADERYANVTRDLSERLARRIAKPSLDNGTALTR
jgi:arylsulfatase A-like enzyme